MVVRLLKCYTIIGWTILTSFMIHWECPCEFIAIFWIDTQVSSFGALPMPQKRRRRFPKTAVLGDLSSSGVGNPLNVSETPQKLHNTRLDYSNQLYDTLGMSLTVFSNLYSHLKSPKSSNFSMPQKRHSLKPTFRKMFKWIYKEWATL